jgi:8-oxo-dGTP pyrophosphatase MutT (NUDIX family)
MDKFCKFCGNEHTVAEYPKTCKSCNKITWVNPTPVAVLLQPVRNIHRSQTGILVGKRGINPQKGLWGLPGGFVDMSDATVQHAAIRELYEETGFSANISDIVIEGSYSNGVQLLMFCRSLVPMDYADMHKFVPCYECPEVDVVWEKGVDLCFPSHTQFLNNWFDVHA